LNELYNQTYEAIIEEIKDTCEYKGETVCTGGTIPSCDQCLTSDMTAMIDDISDVEEVVATYEYCQDYQTTTIDTVGALEIEMQNLQAALEEQVASTLDWLAVFQVFDVTCPYIPPAYCVSMTNESGIPQCEVVNDECVSLS